MKTEKLIALGLTEEQAQKVFAMNGKDITAEKSKFADYDDIKAQLKVANDTIDGFGDVEAIKADVIKYKSEAETAKINGDKRVAQLETQSKVKEFTSSKQFVNAFTKEAVESKLLAELENESSKRRIALTQAAALTFLQVAVMLATQVAKSAVILRYPLRLCRRLRR